MKRLILFVILLMASAAPAFAHGDNDHVRGVVTAVTETSVTIQIADKTTKALTLNNKTTFEKSGKPATVSDLKVGDRVVVDVPKHTTEALLIRFGAPAKATVRKSAARHPVS